MHAGKGSDQTDRIPRLIKAWRVPECILVEFFTCGLMHMYILPVYFNDKYCLSLSLPIPLLWILHYFESKSLILTPANTIGGQTGVPRVMH